MIIAVMIMVLLSSIGLASLWNVEQDDKYLAIVVCNVLQVVVGLITILYLASEAAR